tara:strand:+ start:3768 stop:5909 length:2142 start_codon:yes stop_codon:yes gene_type:complete
MTRAKVPQVFQLEAAECGAACLNMILGYFQRWESLVAINTALGVSRDGAKASRIVSGAEQYGLSAKITKIDNLSQFYGLKFPGIAYCNEKHYVVVEGYDKKKVFVKDPALGPKVYSHEDFFKSLSEIYISFEKTIDFKEGGEKPSPLKKVIKRLKGNEKVMFATGFLGLVGVIPSVFIAVTSGEFIDQVFSYQRINWINPMILLIVFMALMKYLITLLRQNFARNLQKKLEIINSFDFLQRILSLPINFYRQRAVGDTVNRIDESDEIAEVITQQLGEVLSDIFSLLIFGAVMISINPVLFFLFLFVIYLNFFYLGSITANFQELEGAMAKADGAVQSESFSGITGLISLKSSNSENGWFTRWSGFFTKYINDSQKLSVFDNKIILSIELFDTFQKVLVIMFGIYSIINGWMTLGEWVSFTFLRDQFITSQNGLIMFLTDLPRLNTLINRADDVLEYPINENEKFLSNAELKDLNLSGNFEFKNIDFGFSAYDPPLFKDLSFKVKSGEYIGLVGKPGSGTSTLLYIISGIYNPWKGELLFDGINTNQISKACKSQQISFALQQSTIFKDTIKNNLIGPYGNKSSGKIYEKCKVALSDNFIFNTPQGLEKVVDANGDNLSGGEKQLLDITRCLINNPKILLLDQATTSLDLVLQEKLINNLIALDITIIHVTRSNSLLLKTDKVLFINQESNIEENQHGNLFKENTFYRENLNL